jgi:hypothetical protein
VDELVGSALLIDEFVARLARKGLESVDTTRSRSPLCISASAFLAFRMGSGQFRPRVSISR